MLIYFQLLEFKTLKSYYKHKRCLYMKLNIMFGNNIRYFRYQKKLTQEQLAEECDFSTPYISQLELGLHMPSFRKLEILSKVLEVEPSEFYVKRKIPNLPVRVDMYHPEKETIR